MTNEFLSIGDIVQWIPIIDQTTLNSRYTAVYGFVFGIKIMNDEIYYNVEWFGHKKEMYRAINLRKIS